MSLSLEDQVRAALRSGTEHLSTPPDSYARVMETVAVRRRRRRTAIAGAGVTALAVAGLIGLGAGLGDPTVQRNTPAAEERTGEATRWGLPFSWPARGVLASDPDFAAEFTDRFGNGHHLLYAEDGSAGRVIIAVSSAQESVVFHGPRGADLDELERFSGLQATSRDVVVAVPQAQGHLIIALMPGNLSDAQFSIPSVARDGSIERTWRQIPVEEGVGRVVAVEPLGILRVRTPAGDGPPHVVVGAPDTVPGTLTCDRCDSAWFSADGLSEFNAQAADVVGADAEDVESRLVVDVALPSRSAAAGAVEVSPGRIYGYVATLPSGGLLRATYLVTEPPSQTAVVMVEPLRPLPAGDQDRPVFIPPRVVGPALIVAPGSSRVSLEPLRGADTLAEVILIDGVGVIPDAPRNLADYRITSYAPDGAVHGRWHGLVLESDDPFRALPRALS